MSCHKFFSTEKAFTIHFQPSPTCLAFVRRARPTKTTKPVVQKRVDKTFDDTVFTSTKRPKQLRCEAVNELSNVPNESFSALPNSTKEKVIYDDNDNALFDDVHDIQMLADDPHDDASCPTQHNISATSQFMISTDQKWTILLLKILDDMNAPDYAFESVLKWARNAQADGHSFYPVGGHSRVKNVDVLFKSVTNAQRLLPSVLTVEVPYEPPCNVIAYEFAPQLLNLLQNPSIMTSENLLIDLHNPLQPYQSPNGILGDAISGSVYCDAYHRMITDPIQQLFVPIIQWIDRTHVTGNARFLLKPYMFAPAIFKEGFRRKIQAWGYHGFLPKIKLSSAQNQTSMKQGDNICNYHAQLHAVLISCTAARPHLTNV